MDKLMRDMEPETAERIIAGTIAYYRGCSDEVIARQAWIALKSHHRNKHPEKKDDYWRDVMDMMVAPPLDYDYVTDPITGETSRVEKPCVFEPIVAPIKTPE